MGREREQAWKGQKVDRRLLRQPTAQGGRAGASSPHGRPKVSGPYSLYFSLPTPWEEETVILCLLRTQAGDLYEQSHT